MKIFFGGDSVVLELGFCLSFFVYSEYCRALHQECGNGGY